MIRLFLALFEILVIYRLKIEPKEKKICYLNTPLGLSCCLYSGKSLGQGRNWRSSGKVEVWRCFERTSAKSRKIIGTSKCNAKVANRHRSALKQETSEEKTSPGSCDLAFSSSQAQLKLSSDPIVMARFHFPISQPRVSPSSYSSFVPDGTFKPF